MAGTGKTLGALALLTAALPVNVAFTAALLVRRAAGRPTPPGPTDRTGDRLTILVTGGKMTKALQLARLFHAEGHRVVLAESARYRWSGHRFSRAVDRFHVVPAAGDPGYPEAIARLIGEESVDLFVPVSSPASSLPDARVAELLHGRSEVLHPSADVVATLDDKHAFCELAASMGLDAPAVHRITEPEQVADFDFAADGRTYILKSIAYDPVHRLDLTRLPLASRAETLAFARDRPISPQNPWVLQEFVPGEEFCTHSTVVDGRVQLHACCASSAFQLNYEMVDIPEIEAWVRTFVGGLGATGQLSFDFIRSADGRYLPIECNPRTHSAITMFHDDPRAAAAYLGAGTETVKPLPTSRPTYWLYQELWRLLSDPRHAATTLRTIARGRDAIYDPADPLPFLLVHHLQIPALLIGNLVRRRPWIRIDFNIGKLVEPGGD